MDVIYGLIPGMILLGLLAVGVFFWAARSGQFDDLEGEASRILMDDDDLPNKKRPASRKETKPSQQDGEPPAA
ncbi:MAG TPA: cbb3-type cytochrome oxidase assembly protein CcoS [Sedimenticola sp.]|nr:cbb3-type cytochrome oxidase assembly protein CcoS [Sedimenticola sp.]